MNFGYIKSKLTGKESKFTTETTVPTEFKYKPKEILNQGSQPICTACASRVFLDWQYAKKYDLNTIFKNSKPNSEGAELKNVFTYLKDQKLIDDYAIVGSEKVLKTAILLNGPCIAALPVYSEDYEFWNGSEFQGGHAIAIIGWDTTGFIIQNSWGSSWGEAGCTTIPYEEFNKFYELWTLIK